MAKTGMTQDGLADRFMTMQSDVTQLDPEFVTPQKSNENGNENENENGNGHRSPHSPSHEPPPVDVRQTDAAGDYYDPAIHMTDENGQPKLTKTGRYRKRPGRSASGTTAGTSPREAAVRASCREMGKLSAHSVFLVGQTAFGEEWKPVVDNELGINEPENMTTAFAAYYEATGYRDPPPWVILAIALGSYAAPRIPKPKTQSRIKRISQWIGLHLMGWRKKKEKKEDSK